MKKYISYLLASALLAPVFVSCNERLQEEEIPVRTHKVLFSASQAETRTGLSIEGKTVTPDWNKTDESNIHLFETDANNATVYGETLNITMSSDKETAQFEADFPVEMTIVVGVNDDTSTGGSAARVVPYSYTAVVAQKAAGETLAFVIPAEQHPDAETLKDPNADFLVGYGAETVDAPHNYDEPVVDLYFDRAAAMGRVAISNFSDNGEKVQSVTISTTAGLTGSAALSAIDFEKATVSFTRTEGPLSLVYDNGADVPADGTFYAYFVAIPGEATITSIEVVTDQFRYTKEIGKASTFSAKSFKNFTLDLSTATKEAVTPSAPAYVKVTSVDDLVVGAQYLVVFEGIPGDTKGNADPKVFDPVLDSDTQFKKNKSSALDVTITDDTIETGDYEDCQFTLEAGYYLKANKAGKYLYPDTDGSRGYIYAESTASHALTITFDGGIAEIKPTSGTYYLVWSTSSNYFSSNTPIEGDYSTGICLYMLDDGRQSQSFAFTQPTVEYNFDEGGDFPEPTFTVSPVGEVTYSSDNTAVASVNASTGEVTVLKAGTAVISARAAGNNKYRAHTASYTIHSNTSKIQKWVKAEDIEDGEKYLIVSNGEALQNNSGSAAAVAVVENSGVIMYNATDDMIWTAAATSSSGKFTFQNNGQYMQRGGSSNNYVPSFSSSASSYYQWSYNYADSYLTASGNSTYYVYYSTSNSKWSMSTSSGSSHQTVIFKLDDGRTPQEIAFSTATAEYDLYQGEWTKAVPSLQNAQGTVTYTSSNTSVASVNASNGEVTIPSTAKAGNTAVITANAAGNTTYKPGEASYTITIVNSDPSVPTYTKVTSTADLEAGAQYLLVFEGLPSHSKADNHDPKVYCPSLNSEGTQFQKSKDDALDVEISGNTISAVGYEDCLFTLETGYYLKSDKVGKYIVPSGSSSGSGTITAEATASTALSITFDNGIVQIKATSGTNYLVWSTSSYYFSSNASVSGDYSTGICLYKLEDDRTPQTFEFTPSTVEYDFDEGADFPEPTFTVTPVGTLTYSSDNEAVASVNASTGVVTVNKAGTAVITATAAGNASYRAHSASYTIHSNTNKVQKWYKAEAIVAGETYLIVSYGYALRNNSGSAAAVAVEDNSGVIQYNATDDMIWTAAATSSSGKFTFQNNGQYMQRGGSSNNYVPSFSSSASSYYQWSYNYADSYLTASGNSTYYVYYSTSNSKWSMSSSSGSSHQAVLYTTTKPKDARNLQFNPTSVTYDIAVGGTFTAPTLTGAKTDDVTYSSSNTSVASVNASTGAVEIKGVVGTAVITASANETEAYKAGQATYTIKVKDGNATAVRYVLASSIEAGKSYIIVSGGYALKNDNGSVASVAVTPENDALEFTPGEEDDLVWTSTAESGFTDNGHFVLSNGGYRMNRVSSSGNFSLSLVTTSTKMDKYGVWDLQTYNSDTYLYHDSSSTMRLWVYYDGGWKVTYRQNNTSPSSTEKPTRLYVAE